MARKSRYTPDVPNIAEMERLYTNRTGIYARISRSDGDDISESIKNQIKICENFIRRSDDLVLFEIYQDDDYSGSTINRPAFQKMLEDLHDGVINCVVVKDVSRIGRDYLVAGDILLHDFPKWGIRFVSINDDYDSVNDKDHWNLDIILKTVMHDRVVKDTAKKIRSAIEAKMQNGTYLPASVSVPYGYIKDTANITYIPDPETSGVVKKIYELCVQGLGPTKIGLQLDAEGIPCPGKLKYLRGQSKDPKCANAPWNKKTIRAILSDPVYISNRVHGKMKKDASGKTKKYTSKEDQTLIEKAHPAIISNELFDQVQSILESRQNRSSAQSKRPETAASHKDIFLGKLICAECGEPMYADKRCSRAGSSTPSQIFYECKTYKKSSRGKCSSHYLTDAVLTEIVERAIHANTKYILESSCCAQVVSASKVKVENLKWKLESLRKQEETLLSKEMGIYEQYTDHKISRTEFDVQFSPVSSERKSTEAWIEQIAAERKTAEDEFFSMKFCQQAFINYAQTCELTKDIADAMIDRIEVHENKDVIVYFKFEGVYFTGTALKE